MNRNSNSRNNSLATTEDAFALLTRLGSSVRLMTHAKLVHQVSVELLDCLEIYPFDLDAKLVQLGAILHDAGKIIVTNELSDAGKLHEEAGKQLLLKAGVEPQLAQFCMSHGSDSFRALSCEELVVILADNLWKGKRKEVAEHRLIERIATTCNLDKWDVFSVLDEQFELIADNADARLAESMQF